MLAAALPGASVFPAGQTLRPPRETVAPPLGGKAREKRQRALRRELETGLDRWLDRDVAYIVSDEERRAFKNLRTDEERESFVEQFWIRRDPTPDTVENEFREEHYGRVAFANERYASGIPGWKSDRGRIYIKFGPPDDVDSHAGGSYQRPIEEGGGQTSAFPFERWRYRFIEGAGSDVVIEFVDPTMTGEFRLTMDPSEKDALLYVPGTGLTLYEQMGLANKQDRFSRTDGTRLGTGNQPLPARMGQFERLALLAAISRPPAVKYKDLEAAVSSNIRYDMLPVRLQTGYIRMAPGTTLVAITAAIDRRDLQFQHRDGIARAVVHIHGRVTSLARRPVTLFEDSVSVEAHPLMLDRASGGVSLYQKTLPLAPGAYRLRIAIKDAAGGAMTNRELALSVPRYDEGSPAISSLVLADRIERVPAQPIDSGPFVFGDVKVRPRLGETFRRDEKLGIFAEVYNFLPANRTGRIDGEITYRVTRTGGDTPLVEFAEPVAAATFRIEKLLPLNGLDPGSYVLDLRAVDRAAGAETSASAKFRVE